MSGYTVVNILDLLNEVGEEEVELILSDFFCPVNDEICRFIKKDAIEFARNKSSITHLVFDDEGRFVAFFTLTHKAIRIYADKLSATAKKRISRYSKKDEDTNSYTVSAFLIAQFSKNLTPSISNSISGNDLMETAMEVLRAVQHQIGGGIVYLECEEIPQLLTFYQNKYNSFRVFDERYSEKENKKYIQLLRFF